MKINFRFISVLTILAMHRVIGSFLFKIIILLFIHTAYLYYGIRRFIFLLIKLFTVNNYTCFLSLKTDLNQYPFLSSAYNLFISRLKVLILNINYRLWIPILYVYLQIVNYGFIFFLPAILTVILLFFTDEKIIIGLSMLLTNLKSMVSPKTTTSKPGSI